jgi:flagellar motor switch protein FliN
MKIKDVEYQELSDNAGGRSVVAANLALLKHVEVDVEVRIGRATLRVAELFALQAGSMLKLDRLVDEPIEVLLNGRVVAAGHLAVLGEHLGVRITDVAQSDLEPSA